MINASMKEYDYYVYGEADAYGQPQLPATKTGSLLMSIATSSQSVQDNILYMGATYTGLTYANVTDKYVIQYGDGDEKLKVLYVNPAGRYNQVFMARM